MSDNDNHYGSSHYRQFPAISSRLKVDAGTNKPARVKQKDTNFAPQPLGNIKRGDRSQTLWKKNQANTNVIPSDELDQETAVFENPDDPFNNPETGAIIS